MTECVSEGVKRISCLTHCFMSLRVCVCAESNFKKMIEDMSETQQWDMRKWKKTIEVPLPPSLLHCSATPLLLCSATPLLHYTTAPLHHYTTAPLLHFSTSPLHHCSATPLLHCLSVSAPVFASTHLCLCVCACTGASEQLGDVCSWSERICEFHCDEQSSAAHLLLTYSLVL